MSGSLLDIFTYLQQAIKNRQEINRLKAQLNQEKEMDVGTLKGTSVREELFSVYQAKNGYVAYTQSGKVCIGKTLTEVCTEACAVLSEEALDTMTAPKQEKERKLWHWEKS